MPQDKGRRIINKAKNNLMKNWSVFALAIIIIAVVAILVIGQIDIYPRFAKESEVPEATGDVDTAVDALLIMAENEVVNIEGEDLGLDLLEDELLSIDEFGEVLNEYEL